jgi:hypothetical protein
MAKSYSHPATRKSAAKMNVSHARMARTNPGRPRARARLFLRRILGYRCWRAGRRMLVRSAQVLLVACAAAAPAAAQEEKAFGERVEALRGYWLAASRDAARARVLRITNVLLAESDFAVLAGYFGTASAPIWPEARNITARPEGGRVALEVESADGSRVALVSGAHDELRGATDRAGRGAPGSRFSRVSLPEIHRFAAENPLPEARARRGSEIELVYIGADDCSLCRAWEAGYLGQGKLDGSAEWKHLRFTEVKLPSLRTAFGVEHAPQRLQPLFGRMLDSGVRIYGVPSFVLLVEGRLRAHALGTDAFDTLVHPALRAAVGEKLTAPGAAGSSQPAKAR